MMKKIRLILFVPFLMAFQCEDEIDLLEDDILLESGIYAGWQLASQTVDGITDMTPPPQTILEFYPDSNAQDNMGEFNLEEPNSNVIGTFVMDQNEQTITFKRADRDDIVYNYSINTGKNYITFTYTESNAQFEQGWSKIY